MKQNELSFFLRSLVSARKIEAIQKLLDEIKKLNSPIDSSVLNLSVGDANHSNLLLWSIRQQNHSLSKKIIEVSNQDNLSYVDNESNNALLLATTLFQHEIIDLILAKNINLINESNKKGLTSYGLFLSFSNKYLDYALNPKIIEHVNFNKIQLVENSETHLLFDNNKRKENEKYQQLIDLIFEKMNVNTEIIDKKEIVFWKLFLSDLDWYYAKNKLNQIIDKIDINQCGLEKKKSIINYMCTKQVANYFHMINKMTEYEDKLMWIINHPKINMNLEDEQKNKPLHLLSILPIDINIFKAVLEKTQVLNTKNAQGLDAWDLPKAFRNEPVVEYLESCTEKKIMENTLVNTKEDIKPTNKKNRKI